MHLLPIAIAHLSRMARCVLGVATSHQIVRWRAVISAHGKAEFSRIWSFRHAASALATLVRCAPAGRAARVHCRAGLDRYASGHARCNGTGRDPGRHAGACGVCLPQMKIVIHSPIVRAVSKLLGLSKKNHQYARSVAFCHKA